MRLKTCLDIVLLLCFLIWPFVDTLNGFLYYYDVSLLSVSASFKTVVFLCVVALLIIYHPIRFFHLLFFIVFSAFCIVYQWSFYGDISESIAWLVRGLLTVAILFYLLGESKKNGFWNEKKLFLIMFVYFMVMAVNVTLGVLGVGESQYAGGIGGKGFIIAGNEMSYLMLASASVILIYLSRILSFWLLLAFFLFFMVFFLMKATKVAILGVCLIYFYALFYSGFFKVKRIPVIYFLFICLSFTISFLGYQFIKITGLLDRIVYLYILHDGFWGALLSGRVTFIENAVDNVVSHFGALDVLLGVGVGHLREVTGSIVEVDLVDSFIAFGLFGPVLFYLPWLLGMYYVIRIFANAPRKAICFGLLLLTMIGVSLTAGHVVNSGIASSATAFLICFIYICKNKAGLQKVN